VFIDQVKIYVKAGDGGDGCISFRREKFVPRGGPNGGDGGHGGSVILRASGQLTTLVDLGYQQHYRVRHAEHGMGKDCHGKNSPDMIIAVPVGTVVRDAETEEILADLTREGETVEVARGGRGGRGNAHFATPTHRAPREAEPGKPGEERWLILELKLLADVGLVGLPNAGKSTLISRISAARPKTADYPFTTLTPHLGTVSWGEDRSFVVADIPGLIEGAHLGKGLGVRFLRHIERTTFLLLMVDVGEMTPEDPVRSLEILLEEVSSYGRHLSGKPFSVLATKTDVKGNGENLSKVENYCRRKGYDLHLASAVTGEGIRELVYYLGEKILELKRSAEAHV
jgi:GTPase